MEVELSTLKAFICTSEDEKCFVENIASSSVNRPALIDKILNILDDEMPYIRNMATDKAKALFRLLLEYYNKCFGYYIDFCIEKPRLDELMEYSIKTVYKVQASNGIRIATVKEVESGVAELIPEDKHVLSEDEESAIYMLLWTFTGMLRYYKAAGLNYTYIDNELVETDYQLILRAGDKLRSMVDLLSDTNRYNKVVNTLKLSKKTFKYPYPAFADDEIHPDISAKQVFFICKTQIVGKGLTENQQMAKRIVTRLNKGGKETEMKPYEVAIMRRAYAEIQRGEVVDTMSQLDPIIKELCDKIEAGKKSGLLTASDIGVKIVGTIQKTGRCTARQLEFLRQSEKKLDQLSQKTVVIKDGAVVSNKNTANNGELSSIYDALGSGGFDIVQ